jgi:glutathione S-transferase
MVLTAVSVKKLDISTNVQKEPWFIDTINLNGRIPALVDRTRASTTGGEGFSVFETAAITLYLSNHYDKDHKFWFDPVQQPEHYSEMLQWIFFIVSLPFIQ